MPTQHQRDLFYYGLRQIQAAREYGRELRVEIANVGQGFQKVDVVARLDTLCDLLVDAHCALKDSKVKP